MEHWLDWGLTKVQRLGAVLCAGPPASCLVTCHWQTAALRPELGCARGHVGALSERKDPCAPCPIPAWCIPPKWEAMDVGLFTICHGWLSFAISFS